MVLPWSFFAGFVPLFNLRETASVPLKDEDWAMTTG